MARILVAEDEEGLRAFLAEALEADGHTVHAEPSGDAALAHLSRTRFDVLLTDLRMPGVDGMTLLQHAKALQPEVQVIMLTAHSTVESAVVAMRGGAFDYLQKPLSGPEELRLLIRRAVEHGDLLSMRERANLDQRQPLRLTFGDPAMESVVTALSRVAPTKSTVLLTGDSGTGKEVAARAIHLWSSRAQSPFVAVNCAALSENLLESELFGHEKGAFTGASARRRGRIELARGGTFFLDEIGELRPELQAKLLRVLQEQRFERVGGTQTIDCDVRWVAATNRNLSAMVENGTFREDLFHRLAVFPVRMPPLRERRQDILPLAGYLLGDIGKEVGRSNLRLSAEAESVVVKADWPGNVRELRNALERAAILSDDGTLRPEHFFVDTNAKAAPEAPKPHLITNPDAAALTDGTLADLEKLAIQQTLRVVSGNRRKAALRLGIGTRTLYEKLKRYGLS